MFSALPFAIYADLRRLLILLALLAPVLCLLPCWVILTFPDLVRLNLFAEALCDLIFPIVILLRLFSLWCYEHSHKASLKVRLFLNNTVIRDRFLNSLHYAETEIGVLHFSAGKHKRNLKSVAGLEKSDGVTNFCVEIMISDFAGKLNFLYFDNDGLLAGFRSFLSRSKRYLP